VLLETDVRKCKDHSWNYVYNQGDTVTLTQEELGAYAKMKEFRDPALPCTIGVHYFETPEGARKLAHFWQNIHSI